MGAFRRIALALVIIGALNWGLIGLFNFDLVASLFGGQDSALSRIVYSLVGLSGLICLSLLFDRMESKSESRDHKGVRNGNLRYSTEFAEDNDLTGVNEKYKKDE